MNKTDSSHLLECVRVAWRRRLWLVGGLWTLSWAAPVGVLLAVLAGRGSRATTVAMIATLVVAAAWLGHWWRRRSLAGEQGLARVADHVDQRLPRAEHSAGLLLASPASLSLLERVQRQRVIDGLAGHGVQDLLPRTPLRRAARAGLVGLTVAAVVGLWLPSPGLEPVRTTGTRARSDAPPAAAAVPAIVETRLTVTPPAYTGLSVQEIEGLEADVPAGSTVAWTVTTQGIVDGAVLAFENDTVALSDRGSSGVFTGTWVARETVVYALRLLARGNEVARSSFARLRVRADQPPRVEVLTPELVTEVDPAELEPAELEPAGGMRPVVDVRVADDYGITTTELVATLALGAGEQVAFREARLAFPPGNVEPPADGERSGHRRRIQHTLDLRALGLEPGGELYFFVETRDNAPQPQRTRSASHVVRWPGEDQRSIDLGSGLPMLLPPEMFRSQRQIIIDTERLIAEQATLASTTFRQRSNNLGLDQHALRLRYGALLGEETVDGRPVGEQAGERTGAPVPGEVHGHQHDHGDGASSDTPRARHDERPGSPAADHPDDHGHAAENGGLFGAKRPAAGAPRVLDLVGEMEGDLVHAHDSAESATFFTTEIRQTLKSSLANMWEAEKHLRLMRPEQALPYEYRALRLLKEVQQASRVYVRRVGFASTPLDIAGRRLTGDDVAEVTSQRHRDTSVPAVEQPAIRMALASVAAARTQVATADGATDATELLARLADDLEAVLPVVVREAARVETLDLGDVERLRHARAAARAGTAPTNDDLTAVAALLSSLLPVPAAPAAAGRVANGDAVWDRYRARLGDVP